ncbi:MAG: beta-ketoacyl synthase chain length factor [Myxococcales bacterium]|nr:beta-ketoacyl synthase chain length factor [Myxococcales bacterium]
MIAPGTLVCAAWCAAAPDRLTHEDWRRFLANPTPAAPSETPAKPPVLSQVPPMLRRRLTPLSRWVLHTWYGACERAHIDGSEHPLIFASRHGEIAILADLLDTMSQGAPLSPTDFCHSVHHTPTGYMSMATHHRGIARTVSAGPQTLAAGLLETWVLLHTSDAPYALLTAADEVVPDVFTDTGAPVPPAAPYAATFVFQRDPHHATPGAPAAPRLDLSSLGRDIDLCALLREL